MIASSGSSLRTQATAPASISASISRSPAAAVSTTTDTSGHSARTRRATCTPSVTRKPVVDEEHLGLVQLAELDGVFAGRRGRDDVDVPALAEQQLERLAEDVVVLDQDDPDRHPGY